MNELKPCPFCGGEAEIIDTLKNHSYPEEKASWVYPVRCRKCFASTDDLPTPEESTKEWNTRATPTGTIIKNESTRPPRDLPVVYRMQEPRNHWSDLQSGHSHNVWIGNIWWSIDNMFQPPNGDE